MKTSSVQDDKWPLGNSEHGTVFVQIVYFQLSGVLEACVCVCVEMYFRQVQQKALELG